MRHASLAVALTLLFASLQAFAAVQKPADNPVLEALMVGDYDRIESLVAHGADLNAPMQNTTLLNLVSEPLVNLMIGHDISGVKPSEADREIIRKLMTLPPSQSERLVPLIHFLVAHGADVNLQDAAGNLPLTSAIDSGYLLNAGALLQDGASINTANKSDQTPFYAALENNPAYAKTLLGLGPDLTHKPKIGDNYIHLAVRSGDIDLVKYMIDHGADLHEKNQQHETACDIAVKGNNQPMIDYLVSLDKDCLTDLGQGYARSDYNVPALRKILDSGVDVNAPDTNGITLLQTAVGNFQRETVKLLLERGANPNVQDQHFTLLYHAVSQGDRTIVTMLLDKGADVNQPGPQGNYPIFAANDLDMLKYLGSRGARLDVRDNQGHSKFWNTFGRWINNPDSEQASRELCAEVQLGVPLTQADIAELVDYAAKIHKPEMAAGLQKGCAQ